MKIFIIGLPKSGRTTAAYAVAVHFQAHYIDAMSWIKAAFRGQHQGEHIQHYEDSYDHFLSIRRLANPSLTIDHVRALMKTHEQEKVFVIDGISSPKDFAELFEYKQDVVIFLNRTGSDVEFKDHENIGVSVMRDYCFWMASAGLLPKNRWLEYNFKIPGEEADFVKELGSKNSVFIIKSFNKVLSHMIEFITPVVPQ
jgi:hypothetical protein